LDNFASGAIVGTLVILSDIAGRRKAEERLRLVESAVEQATDAHRGEFGAGVPFLQKPFVPETLMRKVREVLDDPRTGFEALGSEASARVP
jgi:hypothetical protein